MTRDGRDATPVDAQLQQALAAITPQPGAAHPSEDDWARFASNEMSPTERAELADHVVSCKACGDVFRVVSIVSSEAKASELVDHQSSNTFDWRAFAAAAALLLVVGVSAWWTLRNDPADDATRAGQPPVVETPAAGTAAIPAPLWASLGTAPDVRLPPDLVLTMRGTPGNGDAFLKMFGEAIAPYREARFAESATALAAMAERYGDVPEVWFYLGAARLYGGAAADAIEPLRRARASEVIGDDARWLEAVALQRAGREAEARSALQVICRDGGRDRQRACAIVKP